MANDRILKDNWISSYVSYTRHQESPRLFHIWTAIATIAGALRRNVYIGRGYWKLHPNLYTVLVAPTGRCRKSTAAKMGVDFLHQVDGLRIVHEKATPEGLIAQMQNTNTSSGKAEHSVKLDEDGSLFIFAPELSVFLSNNSYVGGLLEILTSLYEGKDDWDYTTRSRGKEKVYNVSINLFGASNPEWLAKGLSEDSFGGGFMGRIIFVYQDKGSKNAWPQLSEEEAALRTALTADLQTIASLKGPFTIDADAASFFERWYNNYEPELSGRLAGYFERKPDHMLKLAMILSVSQSNELRIRKADLKTALNLLEENEETMLRAFAYIGTTNEARISQHVTEALEGAGGMLSNKALVAKIRHRIRSYREFLGIMQVLEQSGIVTLYEKDDERLWFLTNVYKDLLNKTQQAKTQKQKQNQKQNQKQDQKQSNNEEQSNVQ